MILLVVIGIFLLILLMSFFRGLYLLWYRRKFTRERFAFLLLMHYSSIVALFLNYVLAPNYIASAINYLLVEILHWNELQIEQPGVVVILAASVLICAYFKYSYKIFIDWNGGKSIDEIENSYGRINISFFHDSIHFVSNPNSRILGQEEIYNNEGTLPYEQMEVENVVWRIQAAELLKLRDAQYKIDLEKHWYSQENCYLSKYGHNGQIVAILCSNNIVSDSKIISFLKFVKGQIKETDNIKYILAIQADIEQVEININGCTIEIVTEKRLFETIVDFEDYKRDIVRRFSENEVYQGGGLTINDIYVEPQCTVYDVLQKKYESIGSVENYIIDWLNDNTQQKQLAILGEYGQGKSVLSLRLAYQILSGNMNSDRIPIIIELRGRYVKQYRDAKEILNTWANRYNINPKALMKLHYAGKLLLIFEGFDELDLIGGEEIRKEHFCKLWEYSIPNSKIIITGRPNYFMDDKEMITLLRLSQQRADSSKYCETIRLEPFKREQICAAMRSLKPNIKNEILSVYDREANKSSFCDLVSRPSLLFLTGLIWEKENLANKLSNINSAEVIRAFLTYCYKRQDEKDGNSIMNSDERAYFMQGIAVAIVCRHGFTNQIGRKELEEIVRRLFLTFPNEITTHSGSAKKLLKNRLDETRLLQAINNDIRSCGVLVKDYSSEDAFCFAHKSFLEVLIAEFATESYMMKKGKTGQSLNYTKVMTISNTLKVDYNDSVFLCDENIFRFVVELITTKVKIEGEENSIKRVQSIYKQMHLYPYPLWILGWFVSILGPAFTNKALRVYFIATICVCPVYLSLLIGISIKTIFISLAVIVFLVAYFMFGHWFVFSRKVRFKHRNDREANEKKTSGRFVKFFIKHVDSLIGENKNIYRIRDLKIVAFFMVCKNLRTEQALKKIWFPYVYTIVEKLPHVWIR